MKKVLTKEFFERDTVLVAKDLLGKYLIRSLDGKEVFAMVVETEAYDGPLDMACHGSKGRTKRNEVMFGEAGVFYVYFTYGMHWMLNVVTGDVGYPAAVLIRGLDSVSGPGRITKTLKIDKQFNGMRACVSTGLWFENRGKKVSDRDVCASPRVGVGYAGKWADMPYRWRMVSKKA